MNQQCTIGRKTGVTLTFCKYLLFTITSVLLFSNILSAADAVSVKRISSIESSTENTFSQPSNFTIDSKENVYILDDLKERILIYNSAGKFFSAFGGDAALKDKDINIYKAYSITCDDYDSILIFEPYKNQILIFDGAGALKKRVTLKFDDVLEHKITDLKFAYGNYFLVDNKNHSLYIFDANGVKVKQLGKNGEYEGEFKNPFSLALDLEGKIYVTDVLNSRVQIFATTGIFLKQLGGFGFSDGGLFRPNGIAVDSKLKVYVSDAYLGVIYVFDSDGKYIAPLMEKGEVLKLKSPSRIKIINNKLYVLEMSKSRISIFELSL